jgi:hypothetical protein
MGNKEEKIKKEKSKMSNEATKESMHRLFEEVVGAMIADPVKSAVLFDRYWSPELVYHSPSMGDLNFEQAKQFQINLYTALKPQMTIRNLIVDGKMAAAQITLTGTHQTSMMGIPATGKHVKMEIVQIMKMAGEKTVEIWVYYDNLSVMKQLGAVLPPVAAAK